MATLVIDIPEKKTALVKQILRGLGVTFKDESAVTSSYKKKLTQVSTWDKGDLDAASEAGNAFNSLTPQQW